MAVQAGKPTVPPSEQEAYAVRSGDLDGDGDVDIYVKRVAGTAWTLPLPEFVLRHQSDGTFTVESTISDTERNTIDSWAVSSIVPRLVDFNADGYEDLLLQGLSQAGVASYDLVVFASFAPGAPPLKARLLDDTVRQFALDLADFLSDPNYFQSAYTYECTISWLPYTIPLWDIDGSYDYYYPISLPNVSCALVNASAYNSTALAIAPSLDVVLSQGELEAGTTNATTVANGFAQIFGVPFMGNALQDGSSPVLADYLFPSEVLGTARAQKLLAALAEMFKYVFGVETPTEHHHYHFATKICSQGATGCTLDHVYFRLRQYAVTGHSSGLCGGTKPISMCGDALPLDDQQETIIHVQADDIDRIGYVGDVVSTVRWEDRSITNTTLPNHVFYPGTVTRRVYEAEDGSIWIDTVGDGNGEYAKMNQALGAPIFKRIDRAIAARIFYESLGIQIPPS